MNEQIKFVIERSLQARIVQCTTQLEILRAAPGSKHEAVEREHAAYWQGERNAAMSALLGLNSPEFGA